MKKSYKTPRLVLFGTVAQITQATQRGIFLDRTFPVNTPITSVDIPNSIDIDYTFGTS